MGTGEDRERELVRYLWSQDYLTFRLPGSGAGTDRELPDIVAIPEEGDILLIELKYSSKSYCYLEEKEVEDLKMIAEWVEVVPVACARFSGDTDFYCLDLRDDVSEYLTPSGNLSMKEKEKDEYTNLDEIIKNGKN